MQEGHLIRLQALGCYGSKGPDANLTSFLLNGKLLVDAGSAASTLYAQELSQLSGIVITHPHLDHIGEIPFIADNIFGTRKDSLRIYSVPKVLDAIQKHLLNGIIWPDFTAISDGNAAVLKMMAIQEGETTCVDGIKFSAYAVNHPADAVGYLFEDETGALLYSGDTGPTEKIWEIGRLAKNLKAILTEVSFPNRLEAVAAVSRHFTPKLFKKELAKMPEDIPIYLYHAKIQFWDEIQAEIASLKEPRIQLIQQGKSYEI